ncbi:MAG: lactate utilization protein [Planctomycetota bacterium]|nr:lactate utilization protein [Planctomycetota bacterium]
MNPTAHTSTSAPRTTREQFFARIRTALEHDRTIAPSEPAPVVSDALARTTRATDDLTQRFCEKATAVGMKVRQIVAGDLTRTIGTLLEEIKAKRVVVSVGTVPQAVGLKDSIRRKGIEVVDWAATPGLESQYDTDAGITDVHAAIAESGTMVCCSDAGHSRGLSLVPPVHIAVVRKADILPDLIDWWNKMKAVPPTQWPSSIALITGPSKTADIEGVLVTGVHGPGTVHILVVTDV